MTWKVSPVGPDAADLVILERAYELAVVGYTRFLIASGDHYFADIATIGELIVVVPHDLPVASSLATASTRLIAA